MASPACAKCSKPVYATEKLTALNQTWHNACFQCDVCQTKLTMKTFTGVAGKPYCSSHVPQHKANFGPTAPAGKAAAAPAPAAAAAKAAPAPAAAVPEPAKAAVPEPAKAAEPEPVKAAEPEPVKAAEPEPEASTSEVTVMVTTLDIQEDASTVLEVTEVDVVNSKGEVIESATEVSEIKIDETPAIEASAE